MSRPALLAVVVVLGLDGLFLYGMVRMLNAEVWTRGAWGVEPQVEIRATPWGTPPEPEPRAPIAQLIADELRLAGMVLVAALALWAFLYFGALIRQAIR